MPAVRGNIATLVASAVQSASGNSGALNLGQFFGPVDAAQFILNVTASSSPTTLDVYLQWSSDAGTTWWDFAHFAQVGAVSTAKQALTWSRRTTPNITTTQAVVTTGDAALAAGVVVNGPIADNYFRAKWVIAGTSYTFALLACMDRD